jgi:hypothetical protein
MPLFLHHDTIACGGANDQVTVLLPQPGKDLVDLGFPIGDHRRGQSVRQRRLGRFGRRQPAMAFLALEGLGLVVGVLALGAAPHRRRRQAQYAPVLGIHRHRRMHEQPDIRAISDAAKTALAPGLALIIDLRRVLHDQNRPAGCCRIRPLRRRRHDFLHRHLRIAEKTRQTNQFGPAIRQPPHRGATART